MQGRQVMLIDGLLQHAATCTEVQGVGSVCTLLHRAAHAAGKQRTCSQDKRHACPAASSQRPCQAHCKSALHNQLVLNHPHPALPSRLTSALTAAAGPAPPPARPAARRKRSPRRWPAWTRQGGAKIIQTSWPCGHERHMGRRQPPCRWHYRARTCWVPEISTGPRVMTAPTSTRDPALV